MKQHYHEAECGQSVDELVFQNDQIEIIYPTTLTGWTRVDISKQVTKVSL